MRFVPTVLVAISCSAIAAFVPAQKPADAGTTALATAAAERFKALADQQAERIKALPRQDREALTQAIATMTAERAKDLGAFLAEFARGPEAIKARLEIAQLSQQNKDLADQAKAALADLDLHESDLRTTLSASAAAGNLGLDDKKRVWIDLALAKAKSLDDRLEITRALKFTLAQPERADAMLAEIESGATTDDERATILLYKANLIRRASRNDKGPYLEALGELARRYPSTRVGRLAAGKLAAAELAVGGDPIAFTAKDLDGKPVSLADYEGKVLLIDFWATWCGPCMTEMPNVLETYAEHHDEGFEILGISLDREGERARLESVLKEQGMTWRQVYDGKYWEAEVAQLYDVQSIPFTLLIGRDGKVAAMKLRGKKLGEAVAAALAK